MYEYRRSEFQQHPSHGSCAGRLSRWRVIVLVVLCLVLGYCGVQLLKGHSLVELPRIAKQQVVELRQKLTSLPVQAGTADRRHTVQKGESLSSIAAAYGTSVRVLVAANQDRYPSLLSNPSVINVGWELVIPRGAEAERLAQVPLPTAAAPTAVATAAQNQAVPVEAAITSTPAAAPIRVLFMVGDVDGADGSETQKADARAQTDVTKLRSFGVEVVPFYTSQNYTWTDVLAALPADVLIYRGHGVYGGSDLHHPDFVGGFSIGPNNEYVPTEQIRDNLHLRGSSVVILAHACFTAGTASTEAIDGLEIGLEEAQRRVAMYSEPFLQAGIEGYFATDEVVPLIRYLLSGVSFVEVYDHTGPGANLVSRNYHPVKPDAVIWDRMDAIAIGTTL